MSITHLTLFHHAKYFYQIEHSWLLQPSYDCLKATNTSLIHDKNGDYDRGQCGQKVIFESELREG